MSTDLPLPCQLQHLAEERRRVLHAGVAGDRVLHAGDRVLHAGVAGCRGADFGRMGEWRSRWGRGAREDGWWALRQLR